MLRLALRRHRGVLITLLLGGLASAGLSGCGAPDSAGNASPVAESSEHKVRGVVRVVERLQEHPRRLSIHHEAIDDFCGVDGESDPMAAMTMSMVVEDDLELPADLAVGDKVSFVLDVAWQRTPVALITSLERIDPETELSFENTVSQ